VPMAINTSELDFASTHTNPIMPQVPAALLELFEKSFIEAKAQLEATNEDVLLESWTLRSGDPISLFVPSRSNQDDVLSNSASPGTIGRFPSFVEHTHPRELWAECR